MLLCQDLLRETVAGAIRVLLDATEVCFDPELCARAKIIGELEHICLGVSFVSGLAEAFGAEASRGDGEDFSADINEATQQDLLALQLRPVTEHGVKKRTRKFAAHSRGEPQVAAQTTQNFQPGSERQPLFRIPFQVKESSFGSAIEALRPGQTGVQGCGT